MADFRQVVGLFLLFPFRTSKEKLLNNCNRRY